VLIAQISDLHVRRKGDLLHHMINPARELRQAVAAIEGLVPRPAFVVATGDLVERGKPKEYRRLRKILGALTVPWFLVAGNHDDRDALREAFPDHAYLPPRGPLQYVVETRPVRLIVLDTTRRRKPGGELDEERLAWLDARLCESPAVPTVVAMHHPPFETGIAPVDAHGFRGRDALAAVVSAHPQVARIVCGHIHRARETAFGGTIASSAPSTAHQLVVDLRADGTYGITLERPAVTLLRWTGREIASTTLRPGDERQRALRAVG
jgi:3',5'-cyclic AMP phosphodiesterase CpdA